MSCRALVTGAAGFAGGHLVDLLAAEGEEVRAWHRPGQGDLRQVGGVSWDAVDLLDRDAVRQALDRTAPDVVYHCAGAPHVGSSWHTTRATFETNVLCSHYLLEALRARHPSARVVVTSSAMVYANAPTALAEQAPLGPTSPYGVSKLAQELVAIEDASPQHVSIARAFNHFGPRQRLGFAASDFARRIAEIEAGRCEPMIAVGNLDARRDLTDVRDTVRAYRMLGERGRAGAIYNVCSGTTVAIRDLLELLLTRARVPIAVHIDATRMRPSDQPMVWGDNTRIQQELGWIPTIPLEQTVDDVLAYWRSQVADEG
ncbi:MAG: GDP-mannose 4,6-dehydratase [Vicinamibacterales bacterium]